MADLGTIGVNKDIGVFAQTGLGWYPNSPLTTVVKGVTRNGLGVFVQLVPSGYASSKVNTSAKGTPSSTMGSAATPPSSSHRNSVNPTHGGGVTIF